MNNYNFSTLNDKEFEELSKDLLNSEFKLGLRSFPSGRDKGIDLRKSSDLNKNYIVVQVKHYINSTYSLLKNKLFNEELEKVKKLKPEKYLIVTSLKLTASQKDDIVEQFKPFIKNANDIFSQQDLNDFLSKNSSIEKKYYKLWLSSTSILQSILNNAVESRTKHFLQQLSNKMKFCVPTNKVNEANEILKNEKILLIIGQAGIGKTTLAEIIIFNRAKKDYKVHKVEDIIEAESMISDNPKEKQIFYFDDFLGANYTEIINSHKTETRLTSFVERIYNSPNKYMVLTTRTTVLNLAFSQNEKINKSKLKSRNFELLLNDYSKYEKAMILYNHLYFKNISNDHFKIILKDKFYFKIIQHTSYTPRIIEFITENSRIKNLTPNQYQQFIESNLDNPEEIWSYSFHNQIQYFERCLLFCLFTHGNYTDETNLLTSFEKRLEYEMKFHNQIIESNQFDKSIKLLLNGFIVSTLYNYDDSSSKTYSFLNPSLADYLINYVNNSISEKKSILNSIVTSKQLERFDPKYKKIKIEKEIQLIIYEKINKNELLDLFEISNYTICTTITILYDYCKEINVDDLLCQKFKLIDFDEELDYKLYSILLKILIDIQNANYPQLHKYVKTNFIKICTAILTSIDYSSYTDEILELFEKYEYNYSEFSTTSKGIEILNKYVNTILTSIEEDKKSTIEDEVENIEHIEKIYEHIEEEKSNLLYLLKLKNTPYLNNFKIDNFYWQRQIAQNIENRKLEESDKKDYQYDENKEDKVKPKNENKKIEKLFNR